MGSFCITCGASGQVIADDDQCVALPILQQRTFTPAEMTVKGKAERLYGVSNSTCGPDAFWAPHGGLITGTYADYGHIDPADTPLNRRAILGLVLQLRQDAIVISLGQNECHDVPFDLQTFMASDAPVLAAQLQGIRWLDEFDVSKLDFEELTRLWQYICDVASENRLFSLGYEQVARPLQFAAFHQEAVDHLIGYASGLPAWPEGTYALGGYVQRLLADAEKHMASFQGPKLSRDWLIYTQIREGLTLRQSATAVHSLLFPFMGEHQSLLEAYLAKQLSFEEFIAVLQPTLEGVYLMKALDELGIRLSPLVYAGQDYDNSQGQAFAKFVTAVADKVTQKWRDRYDD